MENYRKRKVFFVENNVQPKKNVQYIPLAIIMYILYIIIIIIYYIILLLYIMLLYYYIYTVSNISIYV